MSCGFLLVSSIKQIVSILTPLNPFSPKSIKRKILFSFIKDRVILNSGAFIKLLGTINDTISPIFIAFSMKNEKILLVSLLDALFLYSDNKAFSFVIFLYGGFPTTISYFLSKSYNKKSALI